MNPKEDIQRLIDYDKAFDELVEKGCIKIVGINEEGKPLYSVTELGRKIFEAMEKDDSDD